MLVGKKLIATQLLILLVLSAIAYNVSESASSDDNVVGLIEVTDSNGVIHKFDEYPENK